jgi:hypothetical protein
MLLDRLSYGIMQNDMVSLKIYVGLNNEMKENLLLNKTNLQTVSSACTHQGALLKT